MKIVWHADLKESEWISNLVKDLVDEYIYDLDFNWYGNDAIHVINTNINPLESLAEWFQDVRRLSKNITLFQASDEWFSGGYRYYKYFDRVIRNYKTSLVESTGVLTVPLGYPNGGSGVGCGIKTFDRPEFWSFVGEFKTSRKEMIHHFSRVGFGTVIDTSDKKKILTQFNYKSMLARSKFAPCPMGNVVLETWRFYEALESGCIPIVEKRLTLDYYNRLLGSHPIPTFSTWQKAAIFAADISRDAIRLNTLQEEIFEWWTKEKTKWKHCTRTFLESKSYSEELACFSRRAWLTNPTSQSIRRLVELERHRSPRDTVARSVKKIIRT